MPARKKANKENNPTLTSTRKPRAGAGNRTKAAKAQAAVELQQKKDKVATTRKQVAQRKENKKRTDQALQASNPGDGEDARLVELQTKLNEALAEQDRQKRQAERYRAELDTKHDRTQAGSRHQEQNGVHTSLLPQRLTRPIGITEIKENMGLDNDDELYESISAQLKDIFKQARGAVDKTWAAQDLEVKNKIKQTALESIPYLKARCPWAVDKLLTQYLYNRRKYIKAKADPNSIFNQHRAARLKQSAGDPAKVNSGKGKNGEGDGKEGEGTETTQATSDLGSDSDSTSDSSSTTNSPPASKRRRTAPTAKKRSTTSASNIQPNAVQKNRRLRRLSK